MRVQLAVAKQAHLFGQNYSLGPHAFFLLAELIISTVGALRGKDIGQTDSE